MRKSMIEIGCNTDMDKDYFGELIRLDPVEKELKTNAKKTSHENVLARHRVKYKISSKTLKEKVKMPTCLPLTLFTELEI